MAPRRSTNILARAGARVLFGQGSERALQTLEDLGGIRRAARQRHLTPSTVRLLRVHGQGHAARAERLATGILANDPKNRVAQLVQALSAHDQGEPSREVTALAPFGERPGIAIGRRRRRALGLLRDSDPAWHPDLGEPVPLTPVSHKRIVHLLKESYPAAQSGFTVRTLNVLKSQARAGLEPIAITGPGFPPDVPFSGEAELIEGIEHYRLRGPRVKRPPADEVDQWTADQLAPLVERLRPAVIHAASGRRGYELALVALELRRHFGIPVVYEVRGFLEEAWGDDPALTGKAELTRRRIERERATMLAADAIVTLADVMRDTIVEMGIPREHITVMPNAADDQIFFPRERDRELAARLGLKDGPVIGYVSTLHREREGIDLLVKAIAALRQDGVQASGLIVGEGRLRPGLEELARTLGIADDVVFTGEIPHGDVPAAYSLIDVFVTPRRLDRAAELTTPIKPFEAMAMGIPMVVTNLPAMVEIAGGGTRAKVVPIEDVPAMAAAIRYLLEHPDAAAAMARTARDWVLKERTWSANGARYCELYERLLRPARLTQ